MNGKLKALGLALAAVFAMSAIAAGSASAETAGKFTYGAGLTKLDATGGLQTFETTVDKLTCEHVEANTETFNSQEVTATPVYSTCKGVNKGLTTHVRTNGCDYLFTATTVGSHAPVHIVCPAEKELEVKITFLGERPCVDVPEQTPTSGGVVYDNETYLGSDGKNHWDVKITATVSGITYTETGLCAPEGVPTTNHEGTYNANVTVTGTNSLGEPVDITYDKE